MSFAQITVVGNVGQPPEGRNVGERQVVNFSIATNRKVKDKTITTWFKVVSWDDRKNKIALDWVKKGHQVMVVGELRTSTYTDRQGVDQTQLEVDISFNGSLVLLKNGESDDSRVPDGGRKTEDRQPRKPAPQREVSNDVHEDDIPF